MTGVCRRLVRALRESSTLTNDLRTLMRSPLTPGARLSMRHSPKLLLMARMLHGSASFVVVDTNGGILA